MKIQVQGLFSVHCLLKYIHIYSISFFFSFSGLKKSRDLCTTFILNPVPYQKFCLCISYLVSGSTTRLLPLLVMNSFEKSTSCLPFKMLLIKELKASYAKLNFLRHFECSARPEVNFQSVRNQIVTRRHPGNFSPN